MQPDTNDNVTGNETSSSIPMPPEVFPPEYTVPYDPGYLALVQQIYTTMPPERQAQVRRLGQKNKVYVKSSRDRMLSKITDKLCNNAASALFGGSEKRRALFVIGESDSGKTRALRNLVSNREEFRPRLTSKGWVRPFVYFEPQKPLTIKGFATTALTACGYPVTNQRLTEQELFNLLKEQIRAKGVLFMWVDEMQHVLNGNTTIQIRNVSDIIKSLLQIPGWPLHMILSGVPTLAQFLVPEDGDRQLRNRSYLVHLNKITKSNGEMMLKLQEHIMEKANVQLGETNTPEFMDRLIHSCHGAFGTMIKRMQCAAEEATLERQMMSESDSENSSPVTVTLRHYASVYELETAALEEENIFMQEKWSNISPLAALEDLVDSIPSVGNRPRQTKKKGAS
ncbi:AAA family ATPase [Rhizobium leguminosarum]|uniref:ATP-binding protein n=1 Tax=Rhizobium leguminosarum TaxID=384 RepID=UPI001C93AA1B|nr:ATP-binding protein [Rhizobium leguminosarum]MBY5537700.1 AAA family ATPase [Rhizobium leguminosarum]